MIFGFLPTFAGFFVTLITATLCIAWAPFAAFICARIARQKEISVKRHAFHGAIYSVMLFIPWLHLTRQMRGNPVSRKNITDAYTVTFVVAALALAGHISFIFMSWYSEGPPTNTLLDFIIASTISTLTLVAGLISCSRMNKLLNLLKEQQESSKAIDLPSISYIAPFAWAWATMLISSAPWGYRIGAYFIWSWFIDR